MTKLECPHCHTTLPISEWNENVKESMVLGICEELIPECLSVDGWLDYTFDIQGRVDCPECGEPAIFDDINAY